MAPNSDLKKKLVKIQEKEITEYAVYKQLSEMSKSKNSEILKKISEDEHRHYNQWKKYTQTDVNVNRLVAIKYLIISKIFGLIFMMKLMEGNEEQGPKQLTQKYHRIFQKQNKFWQRKLNMRKLLTEMIDEKRLTYLAQLFRL